MFRCPKCGAVSRSDTAAVSIRSALFALIKIGAVTETEHKALDKRWRKYKTENRLDAYGRKAGAVERSKGDEPGSCC